jgi:hypothetical protein
MPAGKTYTPIATTTLTSGAASYTFTSVPSTYTDLVLVASIIASSGTPGVYYQVGNGSIDANSNYSSTVLLGTGSSATSYRYSGTTAIYGNVTGDTAPTVISMAHFQNYSNTTTNKTVLCRHSSASDYVMTTAGLWRSTSAINTIKVLAAGSNTFPTGTIFTLYGIQAA